jgi:hypothetical protein
LDGVTSAIQTQLNAKQATLVSGTNIKTINSTSLLGSGDITISANPSGISGAIQFSNGSAFASDASNLFWDDTNNRLGVGTNAPSATGHFKGSGSTSATTSLLVQNSGGTTLLSVTDDGNVNIGSNNGLVVLNSGYNNYFFHNQLNFYSAVTNIRGMYDGGQGLIISKNTGTTDLYPTALLAIDSTTQGFLPPRMTTTQKNAIATPATGLIVMDITTLKLCCYNGSTWNDLF